MYWCANGIGIGLCLFGIYTQHAYTYMGTVSYINDDQLELGIFIFLASHWYVCVCVKRWLHWTAQNKTETAWWRNKATAAAAVCYGNICGVNSGKRAMHTKIKYIYVVHIHMHARILIQLLALTHPTVTGEKKKKTQQIKTPSSECNIVKAFEV